MLAITNGETKRSTRIPLEMRVQENGPKRRQRNKAGQSKILDGRNKMINLTEYPEIEIEKHPHHCNRRILSKNGVYIGQIQKCGADDWIFKGKNIIKYFNSKTDLIKFLSNYLEGN